MSASALKLHFYLLRLAVTNSRFRADQESGMAQPRKRMHNPQAASRTAVARPRLAPDYWLLGLALLGVALTAYLLSLHGGTGEALFCTAGSGCDVVQKSRWSELFGLPIALWGMGLYLLLALASATGSTASARWRRLFTLALIGVLISVYLTAVAWLALDAFCLWCLVSFALLTAMLIRVVVRRPTQTPASGWSRWMLVHALVLLPALGLIAAAQADWLSPPDDPRLAPLVQHLHDADVKFYGTYWCPECQKQKRRFGRVADQLPYVECSPNGRNGPMAFECAQAGIESFPTWIIRGQRVAGVLEPEELARRTRFHAWNAGKSESAAAAR